MMESMRWKLKFCFRDSKYEKYKNPDSSKPNIEEIDKYTLKHWGKTVNEMDKRELGKYISIVKNWTNAKDKGHQNKEKSRKKKREDLQTI